jgi:3-hydroxybutyrate dehydrogenase
VHPEIAAELAALKKVTQQQAAQELLSDKQPSRAFVTPEQLGDTVAFLCSAAADQITGTALALDGGWSAQ